MDIRWFVWNPQLHLHQATYCIFRTELKLTDFRYLWTLRCRSDVFLRLYYTDQVLKRGENASWTFVCPVFPSIWRKMKEKKNSSTARIFLHLTEVHKCLQTLNFVFSFADFHEIHLEFALHLDVTWLFLVLQVAGFRRTNWITWQLVFMLFDACIIDFESNTDVVFSLSHRDLQQNSIPGVHCSRTLQQGGSKNKRDRRD